MYQLISALVVLIPYLNLILPSYRVNTLVFTMQNGASKFPMSRFQQCSPQRILSNKEPFLKNPQIGLVHKQAIKLMFQS